MHKLQSVKLANGPTHTKLEALVLAVRLTKICLRAVGAESQLFADCNYTKKLVGK